MEVLEDSEPTGVPHDRAEVVRRLPARADHDDSTTRARRTHRPRVERPGNPEVGTYVAPIVASRPVVVATMMQRQLRYQRAKAAVVLSEGGHGP